jgi:hypothetical protein
MSSDDFSNAFAYARRTNKLDDVILKSVDLWAGRKVEHTKTKVNYIIDEVCCQTCCQTCCQAPDEAYSARSKISERTEGRSTRGREGNHSRGAQTVRICGVGPTYESQGGPGPGSNQKNVAEERRQQLLAEHAYDFRKMTSHKLLEALESKVSDVTR